MTTTTATRTTTQPACIATGCPDLGVYVACLASYNSGRLHGAWIDLEGDTDADDLQEAIAWILATSPEPGAEEYAIHDSCGLPSYLARNEWPDLGELVAWTDELSNYPDDDEREAFRLACEDQGQTLDEDQFRDTYCGCFSSGEDYAQELAEDCGSLPRELPWPLCCIDWEDAWRQLTYDGYHLEPCSSGGVHVYRPA
jgi:antirestriction protein